MLPQAVFAATVLSMAVESSSRFWRLMTGLGEIVLLAVRHAQRLEASTS